MAPTSLSFLTTVLSLGTLVPTKAYDLLVVSVLSAVAILSFTSIGNNEQDFTLNNLLAANLKFVTHLDT